MTEERFLRIKNTPIKIVVAFLVFSLLLFSIGVFKWRTEKPVMFYTFQTIYIVSLWFGYRNNINKAYRPGINWKKHESRILRFLPFILIINIFMFLIDSIRSYGYSSFNISGFISSVIYGFSHLGINYARRVETVAIGGAGLLGGNIFTFINLFWYFVELDAIFLGIIYYKKANIFTKILVIINIFEIIIYYVSVGTNIGVFRILLAIALFEGIKILKRGRRNQRNPNMKRIYIIFGFFGAIVIYFFIQTLSARGGILYWEESWYNVCGIGLDRDSFLFNYLPDAVYLPLISISSYLTQGYQAFAYSLNVSWTPMFGFGQSYQFVQLISKYLFDIEQFTYQYKIEKAYGWSMSKNWASAYTWIANDVSLLGVPLILYLFGKLLALTYKESLFTENAYSKILFYFMIITCIFLPCNFQIFQFAGTYFAFIFTFVMWIATTRVRFTFK